MKGEVLSISLVLLFSLAGLLPRAFAEAPNATETSLARAQFRRGVTAAKKRQWADAHNAFARAYELAPRPIILLNLAGAQAQTGKLVEAAESYRRFLREADQALLARNRSNVDRLVADLEARIPRAQLVVEGLEPGDEISLDDRSISSVMLGPPVPLNPGDHALVVRRAKRPVGRTEFGLVEGQSGEVLLKIEPIPQLEPEDPPGAVVTEVESHPAKPVQEEAGLLSSPVFWTVVAAATIATGVTLGLVFSRDEGQPYKGSTGVAVKVLTVDFP